MSNYEHDNNDSTQPLESINFFYNEIKEFSEFQFEYFKALDTRCSTMMSVVAIVLVLLINTVSFLLEKLHPFFVIIPLIILTIAFLAYGYAFIFLRRFYSHFDPIHFIDDYFNEPVIITKRNLIETAVQNYKSNFDTIKIRAFVMKWGGGLFFVIGILTILILLIHTIC